MIQRFRILTTSLAIFFVALGSLSAAHLTGLTLFGVSWASNQLVAIDANTGEGRVVGDFGATIFATDVAVRSGRLFTFDQVNSRLREINKVSGELTSSIDLGVTAKGEGALTFRASDGMGFLAAPLNANNESVNDFYSFTVNPDTGTGVAVRLGSTEVAIDAMAFDSTGTLYAIGQGTATLYTINPATGATTAVGSFGSTVAQGSPVAGMVFAPATPAGVETIYAAIDDRLFLINKTDGVATPVADTPTNFGAFVTSISGLSFTPGAGTLGNMSGRLAVGTGDNVGIGGFIVRGTPAKQVVLRAIGPSLPVTGALADPVLSLFDQSGVLITTNDDFASSPDAAAITAFGLAPTNSKESAILRTLPSGSYTAIISGKNGGTGIGLVELYDVEPGNGSRLANLSTRGRVQPGDTNIIGGVIIRGSASQRVVFRAIGPDLATRGVPTPLADPNLEIFDGNGNSLIRNDDFATDPGAAEINTLGLSPRNAKESATIVGLAPGNYTAVVRGADATPGVALVESYNVSPATP